MSFFSEYVLPVFSPAVLFANVYQGLKQDSSKSKLDQAIANAASTDAATQSAQSSDQVAASAAAANAAIADANAKAAASNSTKIFIIIGAILGGLVIIGVIVYGITWLKKNKAAT